MFTILRRIDIGSAFRVGAVISALAFAVFGLLFILLQGLLLSSLTVAFQADGRDFSSAFAGAGVLGLLCFYGVGIVFAAIFGGIQFAIIAFCYNLTANWVGGIRLELARDEEPLD